MWLPPDLSRLSWETLVSPPEEGLEPYPLSAFFPKRERRSPPSGSLLWHFVEAGVLRSGYLMSLAGYRASSTTSSLELSWAGAALAAGGEGS